MCNWTETQACMLAGYRSSYYEAKATQIMGKQKKKKKIYPNIGNEFCGFLAGYCLVSAVYVDTR